MVYKQSLVDTVLDVLGTDFEDHSSSYSCITKVCNQQLDNRKTSTQSHPSAGGFVFVADLDELAMIAGCGSDG